MSDDTPVPTINVDGLDVPVTPDLAAAFPSAPAAPSRWFVTKLVLVDRLIAAGLAANANAALSAAPIDKMRFDAAVEIYSDDAQARGFLAAIGGNPDSLLAPMDAP